MCIIGAKAPVLLKLDGASCDFSEFLTLPHIIWKHNKHWAVVPLCYSLQSSYFLATWKNFRPKSSNNRLPRVDNSGRNPGGSRLKNLKSTGVHGGMGVAKVPQILGPCTANYLHHETLNDAMESGAFVTQTVRSSSGDRLKVCHCQWRSSAKETDHDLTFKTKWNAPSSTAHSCSDGNVKGTRQSWHANRRNGSLIILYFNFGWKGQLAGKQIRWQTRA